MWEGQGYSWDSDVDVLPSHQRLVLEIERLREEYEGRVFEDPLYLMQYTITWDDTKVGGPQSPENDAFINAENEVYLKKV